MLKPGVGGLGRGWNRSSRVEGNFVYSFWVGCSEFQTVILRSSKGPARYARDLTLPQPEVSHFICFIHLGSERKKKKKNLVA